MTGRAVAPAGRIVAAAALCVALAGCGSIFGRSEPPPDVVERVTLKACPVVVPQVQCDPWPAWAPGQTLRELRIAHEKGGHVADCRKTGLDLVLSEIERCRERVERENGEADSAE